MNHLQARELDNEEKIEAYKKQVDAWADAFLRIRKDLIKTSDALKEAEAGLQHYADRIFDEFYLDPGTTPRNVARETLIKIKNMLEGA